MLNTQKNPASPTDLARNLEVGLFGKKLRLKISSGSLREQVKLFKNKIK
jgi:hypothetical protein